MEPEWRRRNGGITQVSYAGSKDAYNLFEEAAASSDPAVVAFSTEFLSFLRARLLILQQVFNLTQPYARTKQGVRALTAGLSDNMCVGKGANCGGKGLAALYAWVNVFRKTGAYASESFIGSWHGHQHDWHGYAVLNGSTTKTGFFAPFEKRFFVLRHVDNHIVMIPGGIKHSAFPPSSDADHRITLAFDVRVNEVAKPYGLNLFDGRKLPSRQPLYRWDHTAYYNALSGLDGTSEVQWGGTVEYTSLVGDLSAATSSDEL